MNTNATPTTPARRPLRRMYPATTIRLERLRRGLKLNDVAQKAGISLATASIIERDLNASDEDVAALRAAIVALAPADQDGDGRAA